MGVAASSELPCQMNSENFGLQGMFGEASEPQEQSRENQRDEENNGQTKKVFLKNATVVSLKARKQGDRTDVRLKSIEKRLTLLQEKSHHQPKINSSTFIMNRRDS